MRLIGNKTKLLPEIESLLALRGIRSGTLIDIFSGTASVGRHFKKLGFRVIANDILSAGYTQAVAGIEVSRWPAFEGLRRTRRDTLESREFRETLSIDREFDFSRTAAASRPKGRTDLRLPLLEAVHFIDRFVPPREGIIFRNYCPGGPHGRMYFRDEHGRKIDGILDFLRTSFRSGELPHGELHLLLAAFVDAADRVANISGTYGAYLKKWQHNTRGEMRIEAPEVIESRLRNEAHREDSNVLIRKLRGDVLYIDPPYNHRQYAANYHILEIIAEHHRIDDLDRYEASLYGKTGLRPYDDLRSLYSVRPGPRSTENVLTAMTDLILASHAPTVVVSYNEEGLLSREEIGAILARFARKKSFDFERDLLEVDYPRFRSDADRPAADGRGGRSYKVLDGKDPDRLAELLFFASRNSSGRLTRRHCSARAPVAPAPADLPDPAGALPPDVRALREGTEVRGDGRTKGTDGRK
jgi:adenine-specific DNA-methyltransferase